MRSNNRVAVCWSRTARLEDVEVLGVIRRNPTEVELRFGLCKPDLWLGGPEGRQLERDWVFYCHELTFYHVGVNTVAAGINSPLIERQNDKGHEVLRILSIV